MGQFCPQIDFICIFGVLIFVHVFGFAFGKPPASILQILELFQCALSDYFEDFFADAANFKKPALSSEMLVLGGVGLPLVYYFC